MIDAEKPLSPSPTTHLKCQPGPVLAYPCMALTRSGQPLCTLESGGQGSQGRGLTEEEDEWNTREGREGGGRGQRVF